MCFCVTYGTYVVQMLLMQELLAVLFSSCQLLGKRNKSQGIGQRKSWIDCKPEEISDLFAQLGAAAFVVPGGVSCLEEKHRCSVGEGSLGRERDLKEAMAGSEGLLQQSRYVLGKGLTAAGALPGVWWLPGLWLLPHVHWSWSDCALGPCVASAFSAGTFWEITSCLSTAMTRQRVCSIKHLRVEIPFIWAPLFLLEIWAREKLSLQVLSLKLFLLDFLPETPTGLVFNL